MMQCSLPKQLQCRPAGRFGWLLQQFSFGQRRQHACWPGNAFNHIYDLPEQQALVKLKALDAFVGLAKLDRTANVSFHHSPSWYAAKAGHISSLQWL